MKTFFQRLLTIIVTAAVASLATAIYFLWQGYGSGATNLTLEDHLQNPLYAEFYYDDLVERMVQLDIQNEPLLEDASKRSTVDKTRADGLKKAKEATRKQLNGLGGQFSLAKEFTQGEVLLLDNVLYFSPQFNGTPGPGVRVYLSTVLDPRDVEDFSAENPLNLGFLKSPYGAQSYIVEHTTEEDAPAWRTVVLYDEELDHIHGFAQLSTN